MFEYRFDVTALPPKFQGFRFDGGALPLWLVETVHEWDAECVDRINGPAAWSRWLDAAGEQTPTNDIDARGLHDVRELREAILLIAHATATHRQPPGAAVERVNTFAARPTPATLLAHRRNGLVSVQSGERTHDDILTTIAREAVELFGGPRAERIRICAEEKCPTIFVDNSQSGGRVWCSAGCSARAAARTYRKRRARERLVQPTR